MVATSCTLGGPLVPLVGLPDEESVGDVGHDVTHVPLARTMLQLSVSLLEVAAVVRWRQVTTVTRSGGQTQ